MPKPFIPVALIPAAFFLVASVLGGTAHAQGHAQGGHAMPSMTAGSSSEPSMMSTMDKMNRDMAAVPMTGDADRDFVAMMIPHHQGAIDMAQFELDHGKDPALRKMATEIIAAQKKEIAAMRQWQARHPVQQSAR